MPTCRELLDLRLQIPDLQLVLQGGRAARGLLQERRVRLLRPCTDLGTWPPRGRTAHRPTERPHTTWRYGGTGSRALMSSRDPHALCARASS